MLSLLSTNPLLFVSFLIALLVAITVHEFSHAYAAEYLGDPTPRLQGRVNLNPISHLDPLGMLFLFIFGFGWGKPVQFDPFNLKNPRRDAALISLAGPIANFSLALVLSILVKLFIFFKLNFLITIGGFLFIPIIYLNVALGVFNFLPISPLDGFKMVGGILPAHQAREWYSLERYSMIFLILLIIPIGGSNMLSYIVKPITNFILLLLIPANLTGIAF